MAANGNVRLYHEFAHDQEALQIKTVQLQKVMARTVTLQEDDRRRITRDIHDLLRELCVGCLF